MQINWLFLTGILRTMRDEAAAAERREEEINPAALVQFAQMIEDALQKSGAAMTEQIKRPGPEGSRAILKPPSCAVKSTTQQSMVLEVLRQHPASAFELQHLLPLADARAVVRDLKAKGYVIDKIPAPNPNQNARCKTIQRYRLNEAH
ncbi:Winged helix-turn-helix domain-containing protein [Halomonas sp. NYA30]